MLDNNLFDSFGTYISCWMFIFSFQHKQTTGNYVLLQTQNKLKVEISWYEDKIEIFKLHWT